MATIQTIEAYDSGPSSRSKINSNFSALNTTTNTVAEGGTGATTFTDGGVLIGNGTGAIQATAVGTAGQVLTSNGAGADPTFQSAAGAGSVTSVSVATANGFSGTVTNPTTTPEITIIAGHITPTSVSTATIRDAGGTNEAIKITTTASAVNEITVANAATGNNPNISATGDDSNIGIDLTSKGTGTVNIRGNSTQAGTLRFYEDTDDGSNYTAIKAGTQTGDITYTLPTAAPTLSGQLLSSTTAGVMSWSSVSPANKVNINTTEVTITDGNGAVETTLFSTTIPGGTLSTNNAIEVILITSGTGFSSVQCTFKMKYGATTVGTLLLNNYGGNRTGTVVKLAGLVVADGATGAQKAFLQFNSASNNAGGGVNANLFDPADSSTEPVIGAGYTYGTAAEDSTADQTLTITVQYGSTSVLHDMVAEFWIVKKIN